MIRRAALPVLLLLAGCASTDRPASVVDASATAAHGSSRATDDLVKYLSTLRGLSEAGLTREIARQRQLLANDSTDLSRTRLALALSLAPQGDEGEILGLVDPVAKKETAPQEVRAMASFLHAMASERRRLRESAAAANAKLREERRAVEAQKQRADTLQERAAQLQQKLDALTELEKSLSDRPISNR
jgi:septal ring factor EnvC (AmiA/AmiB activator)